MSTSDEQRRREENRAPEESGEGESEGFELAEQELIEHASHGDEHNPAKITEDAPAPERDAPPPHPDHTPPMPVPDEPARTDPHPDPHRSPPPTPTRRTRP